MGNHREQILRRGANSEKRQGMDMGREDFLVETVAPAVLVVPSIARQTESHTEIKTRLKATHLSVEGILLCLLKVLLGQDQMLLKVVIKINLGGNEPAQAKLQHPLI